MNKSCKKEKLDLLDEVANHISFNPDSGLNFIKKKKREIKRSK